MSKRVLFWIGFVLLVALALAGCGSAVDNVEGDSANTDPRSGWVEFEEDAWKICDGTNMLYAIYDYGLTIDENNSECGGTSYG